MRLRDAARRFDETQAFDAYTLEDLFLCKFTSFDDHSSDGATARRRVLDVPKDTEIPARRAVKFLVDEAEEETWIVGASASDVYAGFVIRNSYSMKRATDYALIAKPGETIYAAASPVNAFVQKQYFKDTIDSRTFSDNGVAWNIFVPPGELVADGYFVKTADMVLRVRNSYLPVEGLRILQCDELDQIVPRTMTFIENGNYAPSTDSYAVVSTTGLGYKVEYNKLYVYASAADPTYTPGDTTMLVPKTWITPVVGSKFTMDSLNWRVESVQSELDCWLLHCRIG